jgi:arylsulfatase A-like enzyme
MVNFADTAIGNFTAAIKAKDMWDEMIIVFSADNGAIQSPHFEIQLSRQTRNQKTQENALGKTTFKTKGMTIPRRRPCVHERHGGSQQLPSERG